VITDKEVITDKVNAEIPWPFDGVLAEVIAAEGETVEVDASTRLSCPPVSAPLRFRQTSGQQTAATTSLIQGR
jgi:hypothetical protein